MKNFPYIVLFRAIWQYAGALRRTYVLALAGISLSSMLFLLQPYFMGKFFDVLQKGLVEEADFKQALFYIGLYFFINPLSWAIWGPARVQERQCGYYVRRNFVQACYRRLQRLPYAWHQNFHTGQLFDRVRKAEAALETFSGSHFLYIMAFFNFFGPIVALLLLFKWFGLGCLVIAAVAIRMVMAFDRKIIPLYEVDNKFSHVYAGVFSDYLANIRTIIALRLGRRTQEELLQRYDMRKTAKWKEFRLNEWKWFSIDTMSELTIALLIIVTLFMLRGQQAVQIGSIVMLFQYLIKFSSTFSQVGHLYQELVRHATDYRSVRVIEDAYESYRAKGEIVENDDQDGKSWKTLSIRNVTFAYEDNNHRPQALQDITIDLKAGEKVAFVGESGAGKSTLMTVLRGLYRAEKASLVLDGQVYNDLMPLAAMTTFIPQDPEIFENTIRYNITFGVEHTDDEILHACRIAGFDSVLAELPKGLESDIREKGVNLSGGQKQRLALARGVFAIQQSSLVLMDEPTSSVDTQTEWQIFDRLFAEFEDKAIIASIHRLHLLSRFDTIYYIEQGRITTQGTLPQLIAGNSAFAKLWREYQEQQVTEATEE